VDLLRPFRRQTLIAREMFRAGSKFLKMKMKMRAA